MEPLPLERRGEKRGWMRGGKGRGETFRVLINCFYHRLLCSNLLSSISHPFFSLFLYFILRLPSSSSPLPFFCPRAKSMGVYRCGRARGRNSFRRNEVMKSDPTSLTGLIGLIWRSLYVDKLQGCVHWDAHQLLPWLYLHRRCNLSFRVLFKKEILLIVSSSRVYYAFREEEFHSPSRSYRREFEMTNLNIGMVNPFLRSLFWE